MGGSVTRSLLGFPVVRCKIFELLVMCELSNLERIQMLTWSNLFFFSLVIHGQLWSRELTSSSKLVIHCESVLFLKQDLGTAVSYNLYGQEEEMVLDVYRVHPLSIILIWYFLIPRSTVSQKLAWSAILPVVPAFISALKSKDGIWKSFTCQHALFLLDKHIG